ncbi:hypothetical protein A143_12910 [Vibrio splendidus ZS-139]|nr:hypothetical protein A143_12910 [Vibrio splendidus ZS-139]
MKRLTTLSLLGSTLLSTAPVVADSSEVGISESNPLWMEVYTRHEEEKNIGLQGIIGRLDFPEYWGTYFAAELNTDGYYEWAVGKTFGLSENAYFDTYVGYTKWNYRLSLRTGYNFDNGLMLSVRARPEFGYDDWIGEDANGNEINYGTNLSVRTDVFVGYNSDDYEFFYNRVDHFETDEQIANAFKYGEQHTTTDHEFRVTYTANKWRPYFQAVIMENGWDTGTEYKDDLRWQVGFTLPM